MEPRREDFDLASELRLLRPFPRPEFAADLDARAAAGFPHNTGNSRISLALDRLRAIPARRLLAPAGACALAAIVVATAVVAIENSETMSSTTRIATSSVGRGVGAASPPSGAVAPGVRPSNHAKSSAAAAGPAVRLGRGEESLSALGEESLSAPIERQGPGPYAAHANHRSIERSASIVLGADADEVRGVSAKVFETVHSYDGIVLHSSIASGGDEGASAMFDLLIPSAKLGDALAALSGLAEVRVRHDSSQDITSPTIGLEERLRDVRAKVESLLGQLAAASSDGERAAVEAELHSRRLQVAALRSRLASLGRRAHLSRVSVRIESESTSTATSGSNRWGIDNGLADAGHILTIAAGVTVVGLAVLGPLALLCLLAWLARRAWIGRQREQALG